MKFEKLSGKNKVIYEGLWGNGERLEMDIEPNSKNDITTYKIVGEEDTNGEAIQKAFRISNKEAFVRQYKKAISGNGDEKRKILRLHSSSKCSLLCFYNVKEKPITINIDDKDIVFDFSTFEFKNPVIRYPSNMDVVLLSEDRKTVLFLESKFSEYYISVENVSSFISDSYKTNEFSGPIYENISDIGLGLCSASLNYKDLKGIEKERKGFKLYTIDKSLNYLDGIKQLISHYVGVRRRIRDRVDDKLKADTATEQDIEISTEILNAIRNSESKVYLGEILFDKFVLPQGCKEEDPVSILEKYSVLYKKLAMLLNNEIAVNGLADKFKVIDKAIKYSEVISRNKNQIEKETLKFYGI